MCRINQMYAFVAEDVEGEGVMGATLNIGGQEVFAALVGADMERVQALLPVAKRVSRISGTPFRILRFSKREDITDQVMGGDNGRSGS